MMRRPADTRAEDARAAILSAARTQFAQRGYQAATVRSIARDAAIDPAMVIRYFGSKDGLFAASADVDLRIPDLTAVPTARLGRAVVGHFLDRWEGDPADDVLLLLLRSAAVEERAAERMRTLFSDQLVPAITPVVPDRREAPARAALVSSQLLGLALVRQVLRLAPSRSLDRDTLVRRVGHTVQQYLRSAL